MNETGENSSIWERPSVRWAATILLAIVFVLVLVVLLAADLVSRDLLDPALYTNALEEEDIYNRIYTELLADPAMVEVTALMLGNIGLDPSMATNILSITTSTLYLVIPPNDIQSSVEVTINGFTAYLSGESDELQPEIVLARLDPDVIAGRILGGVLAIGAELLVEARPELRTNALDVYQEELAQYMAQIGTGNIGPVPASVAGATLENISPEQRTVLGDILLGPAGETVSPDTLMQVDAALRANDLPGAMALASRALLRLRVDEAAAELVDLMQNSEAMNAVTSVAGFLGQTTAELIDRLNTIRSLMIFLDRVAIPLMFVVLALCLGAIVWIHANNLSQMLRAAGMTLVVGGVIVTLAWLLLGFVLRGALIDRLAANSQLPLSLETMITDVVTNLTGTIWGEVWRSATIPVVIGLVLLILSFLPHLSSIVDRWLIPIWRYRKLAIVGVVLAIILVPILLHMIIQERRQPEMACNGHPELCDRPVNEVAFATTHNAMSIADYGWIWPSHDGSIVDQLQAGVRGFLIDTHYWDDQAWIESHLEYLPPEQQAAVQDILDVIELSREDGTYLCHMMCGLGATDLVETLEEMRLFLDLHSNEVIILVFEDLVTTTDTELAFQESGLDELVYVYQPGTPWPTLREMIDSDRRVLVMAEAEGPPPEWYLHAWDYTEETPYSFSELADFDDSSCEPNRGDTGKPFFLLNHWITRASPSRVDAAVLNDYDYLLERAQRCAEERGQTPNLVGINFYLNGDVFEVVDELNGVRQVAAE